MLRLFWIIYQQTKLYKDTFLLFAFCCFFQEGDSISQTRLHFSDPDSTSIGDSSQGNVNFGNPLYQMNDDDL